MKWCKSLPLFKNILIDDQIALLINAWCETLLPPFLSPNSSSSSPLLLPLSLLQVRATCAQLLLQVKGLDKFGVNVSFLTDMLP